MGEAERPNLVEIAAWVADGKDVDWDGLAADHPEMAGALRNLRLLGVFSDVCRSGTAEDADSAASETDEADSDGFGSPGPHRDGDEGGTTEAAATAIGPGSIWGPLRILETVGEGSFGEVFRAYDRVLQRDVALKLRRPLREGELTAYRRHLDEARRLARIHHPNVLAIHGIETHANRPGMWTEFIDGQSLEEVVETEGPLSIAELVRVSVSLSRALQAVHAAGLIHGDLKAANVMRRGDGGLVLMDFGAGRELPRESASSSGPALEGTPVIMAPEVLLGGTPTVRSDLYSLGVVLYRLATSTYPIEAASLAELVEKSQRGVEVPIEDARPGVPAVWAGVVNALLSRDAEGRPQNAAVVETELALAFDEDSEFRSAFTGRADAAAIRGLGRTASRLVGRRDELRDLVRRLHRGRVVVLTGPGGVGKTRIAQEAAFRTAAHHRDGAFWIDLSGVQSEDGIWLAMSRGADLRHSPSESVPEVLCRFFADKDPLVVFDNAEHVDADLRKVMSRLLPETPECSWLVTSRAPLRLEEEEVLPLSPLSFPEGRAEEAQIHEALRFDSVRLFVERVHAHVPTFVLASETVTPVMEICRRLEGIPFAIELAAARVPSLGLEEVAQRLQSGLRVIMSKGARSSDATHETLRQSIAWSYDLLDPEEKTLLAGLSVFRGGCTLEAAERVVGEAEGSVPSQSDADEAGAETREPAAALAVIDSEDVLDAMSRLVDCSLVVFEPGPVDRSAAARYRLLETTRTFAAEELQRAAQQPSICVSHLRYFADLAESADAHFQGPEQQSWFERIRSEHDNIDSALRFFVGREERQIRADPTPRQRSTSATPAAVAGNEVQNNDGLRLVAHLGRYWDRQGLYEYGIRWAEAVLAGRPADEVRLERAAAYNWLGTLRFIVGRYPESIEAHEESLRVSRALGRNAGIISSSINMGNVYYRTGVLDKAHSFLEDAVRLAEADSDSVRLANALNSLGAIEARRRKYDEALRHYERGLALQRELKDVYGVSLLTHNIAECLLRSGRPEEAVPYAKEALALRREVGHRPGIASALALLGLISSQQKDYPSALKYAGESMALRLEAGLSHGVIQLLEMCASVARETGDAERTTMLYGAAHRFRHERETRLVGAEAEELEAELTELKTMLGPDSFQISWERGRLLSLEDAARMAIESRAGEVPSNGD